MTGELEDRIARLAARQHGVVTRQQLLAIGLSSKQVDARVRSKRLRRLHRGVYILGQLQGRLEPPLAAEMAAVLASGRGAMVSHWSAAWLLELAPRPPCSAPIHIAVPGDRCPPRRPGIRGHRAGVIGRADACRVEGIPATSPARTLRDLAALAGRRELERVAARAERQGLVGGEDLARVVASHDGRRGVRLLRAAVQSPGGPALTRSEAESRFLELVRDSGLPPPATNVLVRGLEVDFLWREQRLAVEVDGFRFHGSQRSFENDRRRDADLMAIGLRVMRVTWRQVVAEPKATLVRLAQTLARSGDPDHAVG